MDARGTLGVSRDAKVGLVDIRIVAELDTDADDATLAKLAELTERYCVVAQTLAQPPHLTIRRTGAVWPAPAGGMAADGRGAYFLPWVRLSIPRSWCRPSPSSRGASP